MSYLGNSPTQQNFVAGADQFSGTGSQTVFTLSRAVNTVFDIFVTVSNVPQDPFTAYTVAGNTLTFDGAPPSGTNNIDVVYRATNVQTFVPSPGVSQQFSIGTASAPAITFVGNTNTGIFSPATNVLAFSTNGTEDARFDASGNFSIGTTSTLGNSLVNVAQGVVARNSGSVLPYFQTYNSNAGTDLKTWRFGGNSSGALAFETVNDAYSAATSQATITSAGLFQFNSGYGSVATAYGCRAWVNFNGTGTVAIRASGNVTSITDNGTGDYTVNFTNALPDANYAAVGTGAAEVNGSIIAVRTSVYSTSAVRINSLSTGFGGVDNVVINVSVFR